MEPTTDHTERAAWIGKVQVLGLIAKGCTAAQAACMKQLRESEYHKTLDLTWAQFCPKFFGISRDTADQQIRYLDELGAAWFRLNEIVRISPRTFRRIRSAIQGESIEIDGEQVPITAENSARIRDAVLKMRSDLSRMAASEELREYRASPDLIHVQRRVALQLSNLAALVARTKSREDLDELTAIVRCSINKLGEILNRCGTQRL